MFEMQPNEMNKGRTSDMCHCMETAKTPKTQVVGKEKFESLMIKIRWHDFPESTLAQAYS
jgi:hypothetical protein